MLVSFCLVKFRIFSENPGIKEFFVVAHNWPRLEMQIRFLFLKKQGLYHHLWGIQQQLGGWKIKKA